MVLNLVRFRYSRFVLGVFFLSKSDRFRDCSPLNFDVSFSKSQFCNRRVADSRMVAQNCGQYRLLLILRNLNASVDWKFDFNVEQRSCYV